MVMRGVLVLLTILLALTGCKDKASLKSESNAAKSSAPSAAPPPFRTLYTGGSPEDSIKNVIARYNELLVFGYESLNMNPLQEVTSLEQAEKAYYHMAALGEGNVRMISQLKKIDFDSITFPEANTAVAKTRELWDFAYNDIATGQKKEEVKDFVYLMTYRIEKKDGRWLITDVAASSDEKPREKRKPRTITGDRKK